MFKIIPPPEKMMSGGVYDFFWIDTNLFSKKEIIKAPGKPLVAINLDEKEFEQALEVRREEGYGTETFWGIIQDIIINKSSKTQFNNIVGVYDLDIWLEIPVANLTDLVPVGVTNSEDGQGGQLTWGEYGGIKSVSLDETKQIRHTYHGVTLNMNDIKLIGQYANQTAGVTVLNQKEANDLQASVDYTG